MTLCVPDVPNTPPGPVSALLLLLIPMLLVVLENYCFTLGIQGYAYSFCDCWKSVASPKAFCKINELNNDYLPGIFPPIEFCPPFVE